MRLIFIDTFFLSVKKTFAKYRTTILVSRDGRFVTNLFRLIIGMLQSFAKTNLQKNIIRYFETFLLNSRLQKIKKQQTGNRVNSIE